MLKNLAILLSIGLLFASCGADQSQSTQTKAGGGQAFGAAITAENAMSFDDLMGKMTALDSMPAKVTGTVSAVCQKKGCWMTLVSDQPGKPEMRVTFKDYAFFMPKDIAGKKVVIDGFARVETTSVEELRHYAEDDGKSAEEIAAITEPKREVAFEAAGVIVLN